jgi:hypothetical protein
MDEVKIEALKKRLEERKAKLVLMKFLKLIKRPQHHRTSEKGASLDSGKIKSDSDTSATSARENKAK